MPLFVRNDPVALWTNFLLAEVPSYLAGEDVVAASDGASEGKVGAADEASCQGALLLQVGPDQVLLSAGVLAEGSGRAAAVPSAVELVAQRISTVPCGSSGAQ